jgi:hypothetical protein
VLERALALQTCKRRAKRASGRQKTRQFLPAQASAEMLALGASCASHRRSSNANSLCGRNSARSPEICATFQRIFCHDISEFESYMPSQAVRYLWLACDT